MYQHSRQVVAVLDGVLEFGPPRRAFVVWATVFELCDATAHLVTSRERVELAGASLSGLPTVLKPERAADTLERHERGEDPAQCAGQIAGFPAFIISGEPD